MDISGKSLNELKSLAYDQMVELERVNNNLRTINAEIARKSSQPEPVTEIPEE